MSKNQKSTGPTSTFYKSSKAATEIRKGYLFKSPPKGFMTEQRSWKKRFFVLFKVSEQEHHLKYFRSADDMERPLGEIDLPHLSILQPSPLSHPKCSWIQKNFKCSPSSVLYIKSGERDYFLIGESREEVDSWFNDLFNALKNRPHRVHHSEGISKPLTRSTSACTALKASKFRSMSDPPSHTLESISEKAMLDDDSVKRRASEPVEPHGYDYDYPRPFLGGIDAWKDEAGTEPFYETMRPTSEPILKLDKEVEDVNSGTLMRTVTDVFNRMRKQISPPLLLVGEGTTGDSPEKRRSSEFSSSSSENGAMSPVEILDKRNIYKLDKQNSTESVEPAPPQERDIEVKQADLKKHLTLTEVDGKPSVSGWTGLQHTACLFHKGDQILAINDLHTSNLEDVNMYLSKSLKNEVKVTILRLPGCPPLHLGHCFCGDSL